MIIYRRIFGNIDSIAKQQELEEIIHRKIDKGYFSIDLDESSDDYKKLEKYILKYSFHHDVIGTRFTKHEIENAEVLCFLGANSFAYPEPQGPEYLNATYANVCQECGIYGQQKADFVIKKDAKLSKNKLASLHWAFGELFCGTDVYDSFFRHNASYRNLGIKKGGNSEFIRQLVLPELEEDLELINLSCTVCDHCGQTKYIPTIAGFFRQPKQVNFYMSRTKEFFGSGNSAHQKILVSNTAMKDLIKNKLVSLHQFAPCK